MSGGALVLMLGVAWFVIGLTLSLVMGRRGHDGFAWLVLGTVLGPIAVVLAFNSAHYEEPATRMVAEGRGEHRGVAVLVGFDGSLQAESAVERIVALIGPFMGRLTIAAVVPYGPAGEDVRAARAGLKHALLQVPSYLDVTPSLEILEGHPAVALEALAVREGYDIIAIGTRGSGLSNRVVGSTAARLARATKVPVLLVGDPPAASSHSTDAARRLAERDLRILAEASRQNIH